MTNIYFNARRYIDNKTTTLQSLLWLELIFYVFLFMSPTVFKFLFLIPKLILKQILLQYLIT